MNTLLPMRLKEAPLQIAISVEAGTNLLLLSKPAVGKTETIIATAKRIQERKPDFQLACVDVASMTVMDFGATMPNRETGKLDYYPNGVLPNGYETPDWEGIINFGEEMNADPMVGKLMQKYKNNESINGKLIKPAKGVIISDSNRLVDRSGVNMQSLAAMSRTEQQEVYSEPQDNIDFMLDHDWHPTVTSFAKESPHLIDNYDEARGLTKAKGNETSEARQMRETATEEGKLGVWANMRSWNRMSKIEFALETMRKDMLPQRAFGNVGSAIGAQYMKHRAAISKLASLEEILKNPTKVTIPDNVGELYATLLMLVQRTSIKQVEAMAKYIERIQGDLKAMVIRRLLVRSQKSSDFSITRTDVWKTWMRDPDYQAIMQGK
jgi:hypothetical protein